MTTSTTTSANLQLPGFRFHPTEEELLDFYLQNMVNGNTTSLHTHVIGILNIYRHDPWDLPGLANIKGEREWYFFVPRERRNNNSSSSVNGGKPSRTTDKGFWKATGCDRKVIRLSDPMKTTIGLRKTLVFYKGRAPTGLKTDWVMNEYRLNHSSSYKDIVLCKVYRKATSLKVLEHKASAMQQAAAAATASASASSTVVEAQSPHTSQFSTQRPESPVQHNLEGIARRASLKMPLDQEILPELQLPKSGTDMGIEWNQDPFLLTPIISPWLRNWNSPSCIANILNF